MNIVLVHPVHGAKVAIDEGEMAADLKNGWYVYNAESKAPEAAPIVEENVLRRKRKVVEPSEVPSFLNTEED